MSTKTLRKRIALVAVSALGFGVLTSIAPATASTSSTMSVNATLAGPLRSGNTAGVNVVWSATSLTGAAIAGINAKNFNMAYSSGPAGASAASLTVTRTADGAGGVGVGEVVNDTSVITSATTVVQTPVADLAGDLVTAKLSAAAGAPAGTYTYLVWYDGDGSAGTLTGNDPFATVTFTVAGAPTSLDVSANASSAATIAATYTATLLDAAGRTTQALGTEAFAVAATQTAGSTTAFTGLTVVVGPPAFTGLSTADLADGTTTFTVANNTAAAVSTVTITPNSALTAPAPGGVSYAGGVVTRTLTNGAANVSTANVVTISSGAIASSLAGLNAQVFTDATAPTGTSVTYAMAQTSSKAFTVTVTGATAGSMVILGSKTAAATFAAVTATVAAIPNLTVNGVLITPGTTTVAAAADASGTATFSVVVPAATTPAELMAVAFTVGTSVAVLAYAASNMHFVASAPLPVTYDGTTAIAAATTVTTPIVKLAGETTVVTGSIQDQYGNKLANAAVSASNVGGSTATKTIGGTTDINGAFSLTVPAFTTTETTSVLTVTASDIGGAMTGKSLVYNAFTHSATGTVATLTILDAAGAAFSSRTIPVVKADNTDVSTTSAASTDNWVALTITTTVPGGVTYTATAQPGSGIRLYTGSPAGVLTAGDADGVIVGTGVINALKTTLGSGTITVTAGGRTAVYTLTGIAPTTPKVNLVTLTPGTNADGSAAFTVSTTDIFGHPVSANVDLVLTGLGSLSNGFKNMTITTTAAGTNSFSVVYGGAGASGITATVASGSYEPISAAEALVAGTSVSVQSATASVTVVSPAVATATLDSIAATLAAMIATAATNEAARAAAAVADAAAATAAATAASTNEAARAAAATAAATAATAQDAKIAALQAALDAAATAAAAQDAKIAALQTALDAAATVAATNAAAAAAAATAAATTASTNAAVAATTASTNAAAIAAAIAAAQAAAVAAADTAAETAAEAVDAARDAEAAAKAAEEAADLATAAAEQAGEDAVAAAQKAEDAALEAIDAGMNAYDAATGATEAAELAESAAVQAGEDAVKAVTDAAADAAAAAAAAAELAAEVAESTAEAIAVAGDASNAAEDAAASAYEAAESAGMAAQDAADAANAATAAAQEASDAVAALSTQVTAMMSDMKKQITALTNLVIRIQKKVKA